MTIGIDISQIVYEGTGVARYTKNLVEAILNYDTENDYVFFFSSLRRTLDSNLEKRIKQKHKLNKFFFPPQLLNLFWNQLHQIKINHLIGICDVFISSDWTQPPISSPTKKVTIVHDLVFLKYPETLHPKIAAVQKRRLYWVKKECDLIIVDSQSTKKDLITLLNIEKRRLRVVYPAVEIQNPTKTDFDRINKIYNIRNTKYILSVGKLEPRKNLFRLISSFQKADLKDAPLLIIGPKGWDSKEFQISNLKLQIPKNVKFLGYVPDADLYALYSQALFFIYPSIYEGFGYPIVEAMTLGCPVAASNTSSMKEIVEGYGLLFNPESEDAIVDSIKKLYTDEGLRKELIEKGKKRAEDFGIKKFAEQFISAFK